MNTEWVIIADDFTGAGDSAVQFGSAGKPVRLLLKPQTDKKHGRSIAATVVDTDTRFLSADEAYERVAAATRELHRAGARAFFKKIDSTLRGNPADETAAVMDAAGFSFAIVAPSAPRNKRTVSGGICYVAGVPLASTAVSRDPFTPVTESRVSTIMGRRFPGAVRELGLDLVRSGKDALQAKVRAELQGGARVFVADAETMEDLKAVADLSAMEGALFVGSSGLAEALADKESVDKPMLPRIFRGRVLFVIGSVTPTSAVQCDRLVRVGGVYEAVAQSQSVLDDPAQEMRRMIDLISKAPARRALLIRTTGTDKPGSVDLSDKEAGASISRFLGELTLETARLRKVRFLFASGGDTAAKIASRLGAASIDFVSEILPGLPFGFFRAESLERRLYFVSKSGGFGDQDAMAKSLTMVSPLPGVTANDWTADAVVGKNMREEKTR
jgi:uncharacterized protein YgbK (DUF1537 family)